MKTAALISSLSIHAFFGIFLFTQTVSRPVSGGEPIQISYVHYEKPLILEKTQPQPKTPVMQLVPLKIPAKPHPAKPVSEKKTESRVPVFSKKKEFASENFERPQPAAPAVQERPKTALDFMTDPQKGKIFYDYFGRLKEKIDLNLRRKYHGADDALGVVSLYFVLNPDGSLVKAGVLSKESDADISLQKIALESLRRSAPFGGFPHDLGNGPLAFNLKIYFDELEHE